MSAQERLAFLKQQTLQAEKIQMSSYNESNVFNMASENQSFHTDLKYTEIE